MHHDDVLDLFAALLAETCHNVATEPELQPLNGTPLHTRGTESHRRRQPRHQGWRLPG